MPRSSDRDEPEEEADSKTPTWMRRQLERAVTKADLGLPTLWPTEKRAQYALRLIGAGGVVSYANPASVRRAIIRLRGAAG